ncbi:hypothetical protein [Ideonella oryzae]|uniref:Transmembrane protein n=1 Tax=Ideonella oryzae TaxID=2937441 RepID=A0ABT1BHN1_9BURK|nr:hypothetical protein [Ideonella oryzae]MCO5975738.1 hypothetical protein [Ideonella oryzae]
MKFWFKGLAWLVAVTCVVWIAVLWHWRSQARDIAAADLWVYLVALPLVITGLLLAGRWAFGAAVRKQSQADAERAAAGEQPADSSTPGLAPLRWQVLGQWVHLALGSSPEEVLEAVAAGTPRPSPDPALRDDQGLPVLSARCATMDPEAVAVDLPQPQQFDAAGLRALAGLVPVVDALSSVWGPWAERFQPSSTVGAAGDPLRRVRVLAHWPLHWSEAARAQAMDWLRRRLTAAAGEAIPPSAWWVQDVPGDGVALLVAADKLLETLHRQSCDDLVLTLACHSDLDMPAVDRLLREQRLFQSERQPRGVMPGEGAVAMLWATQPWPLTEDRPPVQASRMQAVCREQSIDAPGRTRARELSQAVGNLLEQSAQAPQSLCALVSDSDQHTARATELFAVSLSQLPQLEPAEDMRLVGALTGHLGGVSPLATLALAAAWAGQGRGPLLAVSVGDRYWRLIAHLHLLSDEVAAAAT